MSPHRPARYAALTASLCLLGVLAGCTDEAPDSPDSPAVPSGPATPSSSSAPAPTDAALDWQPTDTLPSETVVVSGKWRAVVSPDGRTVTVSSTVDDDGLPDGHDVMAPSGRTISQVLLDDTRAVVVAPPAAETGTTWGTVVDLADGSRDPVRTPVPAAGGAWAMHGDELRYPATGPRRTYCLAARDLPSGEAQLDHCAAPGEGFSQLTMSEAGTAMLAFGDRRPTSCRTPVVLTDGTAVPVEGAAPCRGWDAAATETGAVWSEVRDERRVSRGRFIALDDGATIPLGPGATGTLTPCGGSVFFAAAPTRGEPTRVLRWRPGGQVEVAYRSAGTGRGFVSALQCAGDVLNLTVLSDDGDEQVWAKVD